MHPLFSVEATLSHNIPLVDYKPVERKEDRGPSSSSRLWFQCYYMAPIFVTIIYLVPLFLRSSKLFGKLSEAGPSADKLPAVFNSICDFNHACTELNYELLMLHKTGQYNILAFKKFELFFGCRSCPCSIGFSNIS